MIKRQALGQGESHDEDRNEYDQLLFAWRLLKSLVK